MQSAPDPLNCDFAVLEAGHGTHTGQLVPDIDQTPQRPVSDKLREFLRARESTLGRFALALDQLQQVVLRYRKHPAHRLLSSGLLLIPLEAAGIAPMRPCFLTG